MFGSLLQLAKRLLVKKYFSFTVIVTMSLAISAFLTATTLANLLLLDPLPYPDSERIVKVEHIFDSPTGETNAYTYPGLVNLYNNKQFFEQASMALFTRDVVTSLVNKPTIKTAYITPEFLSMMAAQTKLGRTFSDNEGFQKSVPAAVISYDLWQTHYGQNPDIINKTITISNRQFQIIGVLDRSFVEPEINQRGQDTKIWLAWDFNPSVHLAETWYNIDEKLILLGKVHKGIKPDSLNESISQHLYGTWKSQVEGIPFFNNWSIHAKTSKIKDVILGSNINLVYFFIVGTYGLIFIACVNISNLFLMRTVEMYKPLAIRAALGASKTDLFKEIFNESAVLITLSTVLGFVLSYFTFGLLQQHLTDVLPRLKELSVDGLTIGLATVSVFGFTLLFSQLSISIVNYKSLLSAMQTSGKGAGIKVSGTAQKGLMSVQVFCAIMLIVFCTSVLQKLYEISKQDLGFNSKNIYSIELSHSEGDWPEEATFSIVNQLEQALNNLPSTEYVQQSASPLDARDIFVIKGTHTDSQYAPEFSTVSPKYFNIIEQQFIEGKAFSFEDVFNRNPLVIINETFAKELSSDGNAIGKQLTPDGERMFTISGIVADMKFPGQVDDISRMYRPAPQSKTQLLVKFKPGQALTKSDLISLTNSVSPEVNIFTYDSIEAKLNEMKAPFNIIELSTIFLMLLCTFLAVVGLYGLQDYSSRLNSSKIATKMAIGASPTHIITDLLTYNLKAIIVTVIVALVSSIIATRFIMPDTSMSLFLLSFIPSSIAVLLIYFFVVIITSRRFVNRPIADSFNYL
jgi:predicted permease